MTTPQDSPRRRKQKARRTKQLNEWRIKNVSAGTAGAGATKKAAKTATATKAK
jgi:hypothetical protein